MGVSSAARTTDGKPSVLAATPAADARIKRLREIACMSLPLAVVAPARRGMQKLCRGYGILSRAPHCAAMPRTGRHALMELYAPCLVRHDDPSPLAGD